MKRISLLATIAAFLIGTTVSAHITVSPQQSKAGATQAYEVRVHNENEKDLDTTSVVLDVPEGVTVVDVGKPPSGAYTTAKTGTRITSITWRIQIPANKYVELPFTAKNPAAAKDLVWNVHQHLAGGSVIDWSDKPGALEKPSTTKITAAGPAPKVEPDHAHQ